MSSGKDYRDLSLSKKINYLGFRSFGGEEIGSSFLDKD